MEMPDEIRPIDAARLTSRCARRISIIFRAQKNRIILALVSWMLLQTCGIGWAQSGPQIWAGNRMQPRATWHYGGGPRFGSPYARRQQQRHQEHLPQWFRQHQNLSPQDQQRALRNQPGFNRLPPWEQQRLFNRLQQLDTMPPARRERTLQRMEALERLSPEQRQQVRSAMQQVTMMPANRRWAMHNAFRYLSQLPPERRWAALNSPRFRAQFSNWERQTLGTLLSIQPNGLGP